MLGGKYEKQFLFIQTIPQNKTISHLNGCKLFFFIFMIIFSARCHDTLEASTSDVWSSDKRERTACAKWNVEKTETKQAQKPTWREENCTRESPSTAQDQWKIHRKRGKTNWKNYAEGYREEKKLCDEDDDRPTIIEYITFMQLFRVWVIASVTLIVHVRFEELGSGCGLCRQVVRKEKREKGFHNFSIIAAEL